MGLTCAGGWMRRADVAEKALEIAVRYHAQGMAALAAEDPSGPQVDVEKLVEIGVERALREARVELGMAEPADPRGQPATGGPDTEMN